MSDFRQTAYKVLLAVNDRAEAEKIIGFMKADRFNVYEADDAPAVLTALRNATPDIIVMDVGISGADGLTVLKEIRKESLVPVILLSDQSEEFDRLLGLEMGADEYLTRPIGGRELSAHCRVILRRIDEWSRPADKRRIRIENLEIDMGAFTVTKNGQPISCTPKETEILWMLVGNPGIVFSREHLLQSIWGYDYTGDTRAVDSHIKRLRAKLCSPEDSWDIRTVWGVGYRFEIDR